MANKGWSPTNKAAGIDLSLNDERATTASGTHNGVLCDTQVKSRKYWEIKIPSGAVLADTYVGVAKVGIDLTTDFSTNSLFWGWNISTGTLYSAGTAGTTNYGGVTVAVGDTIGIACNMNYEHGELYFSLNNTWLNNSDPALESNPALDTLDYTDELYAAMHLLENSGTHDIGDGAFYSDVFDGDIPAGFYPLILEQGGISCTKIKVVKGYDVSTILKGEV